MRQLYEYHPVVGYRYIPGLKARIPHEGGGYLMQVNEQGFRADRPFAVVAACKDAWDLDGYRRLHDAGVTHLLTQPWMFYAGDTTDLDERIDGIARFSEDIIARW